MISKDGYAGDYSYNRFVDVSSGSLSAGWKHWVGDIPVPEHLVKFYNEVKHKRKDIVARVDHRPAHVACGDGNTTYIFTELGIAFKDAPELGCGGIGMERHSDGDWVYYVRSPLIRNEKYKPQNRDGYHVLKTKNFAKAIKNVLQYIKPVEMALLMNAKEDDLSRAVMNIRAPAQEVYHKALNMGRNAIRQEIDNMVRMGYAPMTQEFKEAFALIETQGDDLKRVANYKPRTCFVWAKPDKVEFKYSDDAQVYVVYNVQDVPENVRDKIAVLQIGNEGDAVMDVGTKISNTMYWVFL